MRATFTKVALALSAAGMLAAALPAQAAVSAHAPVADAASHDGDNWQKHRRHRHRGYDRGYDRSYQGGYGYNSGYNQGYYGEPVHYNTRTWRGDDGRYYCRRSNGTTGLLIGGAAGALLGREVAGRRGDQTLGMILGAAGGALLGREIDGGGSRCR